MSVFISWAGKDSLSHRFALALKEWITGLFTERLECFVSTNDIGAGTTWLDKLFQAIESSEAGIVVVTQDSIKREWLLFEAGALARKVGWNNQRLCPLLIDLHPSALNDPLASFQYKSLPLADEATAKESMRSVIEMLHQSLDAESQFADNVLRRQFEAWWPQLWRSYGEICAATSAPPAAVPTISTNDLYLEVRGAFRQITESIADLQRLQSGMIVDCPYCHGHQKITSVMHSGDTRSQRCDRCHEVFNVHANRVGTVFTRPIATVRTVPLSAPEASYAQPFEPGQTVRHIEIEPLCCHCSSQFRVPISTLPGSTTTAACPSCGKLLNVHTDSQRRAFTRPREANVTSIAERDYTRPRDFLQAIDCWIAPEIRRTLLDWTLLVSGSTQSGDIKTPSGLSDALAAYSSSQPAAYVAKKTINRFVRLLLIGGAFRFKEGEPGGGGFRAAYINTPNEPQMIAALFRSYMRRLRTKFEIQQLEFETLASDLEADSLPGGRDYLAAAIQEALESEKKEG